MKITQQQFAIDAEPIDGTLMCYPMNDGTIWLSVKNATPQLAGITLMDPGELRELAHALLVLAGNLHGAPGVNIDPSSTPERTP